MTAVSLIRGRVARVTKVDACGAKVLGPKNVATTDGWVSAAMTSNVDEGTTITVLNANGKKCINDVPTPVFSSYGVVLTFCQVDPEVFYLLTGNPVVYDAAGTVPVGFDINSDTDLSTIAFALELWSMVPSGACAGGSAQYGYFLLPFLKNGVLGDYTIENDAVSFTITGAITQDGNAWGVGPHNVVKNASNVDSPLNVALSTKNHQHFEITTVAPPAAAGAFALGVPATSAVAGAPGTYLPANSYGRASFAALSTPTVLTASPATNWTAGQYIVCLNGDKAYWNGTTWTAGIHP